MSSRGGASAKEPPSTDAPHAGAPRLIASLLRDQRRHLVLSLTAAAVHTATLLALPLLTAAALDAVVQGRTAQLRQIVLWLLILGLVQAASSSLRRYHSARLMAAVGRDLRNRMFRHVVRLPFAYHGRVGAGQLMSRASSDVTLIENLSGVAPFFLQALALGIGGVVLEFFLSPLLAVAVLLSVAAVGWLALRAARPLYASATALQQDVGSYTQFVEQQVAGIRVLKGHAMEPTSRAGGTQLIGKINDTGLRLGRGRARFTAIFLAVPGVALVVVMGLGGSLAVEGDLTPGQLLAFIQYMYLLISPVVVGAQLLSLWPQASAAATRVDEVLAVQPSIADPDGPQSFPAGPGTVRFEQASFGYEGGLPAVEDLTLEIPGGTSVALVGRSGSGKTTLTNLLPRFYEPTSGCVTIDGIDVAAVSLDELRRTVRVVFEDTVVFSASIRDNIALARPTAEFSDVVEAAKLAQGHDFIQHQASGYETIIGEQGATLSGGQRQRLAIARAILAAPRVLVLDDATSALDPDTDEAVRIGLREVMKGRTTLLVAHRLETVALADHVVLLDRGRIVAQGRHEDLRHLPAYRAALALDEADDTEAVVDPAPEMTTHVAADPQSEDAGHVGDEPLDVEGDRPPRPSLRRIVADLRPHRRPLGVLAGAVVGDVTLGIVSPLLFGLALQGVVEKQSRTVAAAALALALVAILTSLANGAIWGASSRFAQGYLAALRRTMLDKLLSLDLDFFGRSRNGKLVARLTTDVESVQRFLEGGVPLMLRAGLLFTATVTVLFTLSAPLALATLATLSPLVIATIWYRRRAFAVQLEVRERTGGLLTQLNESLVGIRVVQAFGAQDQRTREFGDASAAVHDSKVAAAGILALYQPVLELLQPLAIAVVLLIGAELVSNEAIGVAVLVTFLLSLNRLFEPVQQASELANLMQTASAAFAGIFALRAEEPLVRDLPGAEPLRIERGELTLERICFRYAPHGRDVLHHVDLRIAAGERLAIVGSSGAGKSTIAKLLCRAYDPTSGRVIIDGQDLTRVTSQSVRAAVALVPQEGFLFDGTVADNIALARVGATRADVQQACDALGVRERLEALSDGLDTVVSNRGLSLSSGQRQVVALARAFLADPAVLVLDEATSNLDPATDLLVERAMRTLLKGRTSVVIAHRLRTAARADRVVVMVGGRIAEVGTPAQLRAAGGPFARWSSSDAMALAAARAG